MVYLAPSSSATRAHTVASEQRLTPSADHAATDLPAPGRDERIARQSELDCLGDEIATLAAHVHAATYRLLVLVAEFDERAGWSGFHSCAHWLSWRTGIAAGAAREKVRTARALRSLPAVSAAMASGELSFAKVRAITRVATPDNEADLLEVARNGTAAQVERIVRAWRRVDALEEQRADGERHESRHLSLYIDDDGMYVVRGRLEPEAGALLERALEIAGEKLFGRRAEVTRTPAAKDNDPTPAAQRRADAIALVAERALAQPSEAARRRPAFEVVVHVDADALRAPRESGQAVIAGGARVSAETSRRIACDAARVIIASDRQGDMLSVGRRTRTVPPSIRRALEQRDRRCRFPGCDLRFCDAHHIVHWGDGGATSLDNLVLLCRRHHRAVHEGGFHVERDRRGALRFSRPDGRSIPVVPSSPRVAKDLTAVHQAQGLTVDGAALTRFAAGTPFDLGLTLHLLRGGD